MSTNQETVRELVDVLSNDSENIGRLLPLLADDCVWVLYPGATRYEGLEAIRTFITVALELRGSGKPPAKILVHDRFGNDEQVCIEYAHTFSFGASVPLLGKSASATEVQHCNTYRLRDGKIVAVHEYASSSLWWLNLAMHVVLRRVYRRTMSRLRTAR
jgi:hypothetical protein